MHTPGPTLTLMVAGPTWDALFAQCRQEGIAVCRARLDEQRGLWEPSRLRIWVDNRLCDRHAAPVLVHEMFHAHRGDAACQPSATEAAINERVAHLYVDADLYAWAERIRGPYPGAIADELDLPQWIIEAWRHGRLRSA